MINILQKNKHSYLIQIVDYNNNDGSDLSEDKGFRVVYLVFKLINPYGLKMGPFQVPLLAPDDMKFEKISRDPFIKGEICHKMSFH